MESLTLHSGQSPTIVRGVRSWPMYLEFIKDPLGCLDRGSRRYGPVFALCPSSLKKSARKHLLAFTPECNQRVLSDAATFRTCSMSLRGAKGSAMNRIRIGFNSSNGDGYQKIRKLTMSPFSKKAVQGYHHDIVAVTQECLASWPMGATVNMAARLREMSLRISCRLLFGAENSQRAQLLSDLFEDFVKGSYFSWAMLLPFNLPGLPFHKLTRTCERLAGLLDAMLAERRARPSGARDILEMMLRELPRDAELDLIGPICFLFIASFETLATAMTWILFLLAQHPRIMADLHDELFGQLHGEPPQSYQCERLPLLEAVIQESMRLLPPVPIVFRKASQDVDLGGIAMRTGDWLFLSQYMTQRLPELFPQPRQFLPERWFRINPGPYEYFPFGAGPRSCIGYTLGMSVLKTSLAVLLQQMRFAVVPDTRIDRVVKVTLNSKRGMPMILHPQDGRFESVSVRGQICDMVDLPAPQASARRAAGTTARSRREAA